ncbi:histone-lysine N-methyltransferase ATX2-like isoform X2 [Henckelia pumila]|uniref:histone-lysine N-methyltransferase ATX2-like isoform X2 n=1 Tax=Henckelia pumila TaxID=405737 RepID=UPI003C6E3041
MEKAIGNITAKTGCWTFLKGGFELTSPLKMSELYLQCSNSTCRVAYHPLCARVAGFCVECYMKPEDVDRLHFIPFDEDEEDQCIQLLDYL